MTWEETDKELAAIEREFFDIHEIFDKKNPQPDLVALLKPLRKRAIELHNIRIDLTLKENK